MMREQQAMEHLYWSQQRNVSELLGSIFFLFFFLGISVHLLSNQCVRASAT